MTISRVHSQCLATFMVAMFFLFSPSVSAQIEHVVAHAAFAEKIYLQLDAEVYTTDQTIWGKAVVVQSSSHQPSTWSGVLHVELVGPDERVVQTKRVKLANGTGDVAFELKVDYVEGKYLVRAYTEWNRNFGADFIFQTYVDVFPAISAPRGGPITTMRLQEQESGTYLLEARLFPKLIDSTHTKQLAVYMTVDGQKDALSLKPERGGHYLLDYPLPAGANIATINIETQNGSRYTRTIAIDTSFVDVRFLPESGKLVHGLATRVGFKSENNLGEGVVVSGSVMDSRGNTVASFTSNHLGMGSFALVPDSALSYYAVLDEVPVGRVSPRYYLPEVAVEGRTLSVSKKGHVIDLVLQSTHAETDSLQVLVSCRGTLYFSIRGIPKDNRLSVSLPATELPEGVISFLLLGADLQPLAERLYFNQRPETRLQIEVSTDKATYQKREEAHLTVKVADNEGRPTEANFSVLVANGEHLGKRQSIRQNILTNLLLGSELRGEIADPGYYFQPRTPFEDLDALMLTQGWRHYKYDQPPQETFDFLREPIPYVSGTVGGVWVKRAQEGVGLSIMAFGQSVFMDEQQTDSLGRFLFPLVEEYVDSLAIVIQSANQSGRNRDYSVSLDERHSPDIVYDHGKSIQRVDSVVSFLAEKRQERAHREVAYQLSAGGIMLEEVLVERRVLSPQQQKVQDRFGEPDVIIDGKRVRDKEQKWSYGLYSVLRFNFRDDILITGGGGEHLRARIVGEEATLVVVDGIPVVGHDYGLIPYVPPSEVKSIEVIRSAKNFASLYQEAFPGVSPMSIPMRGGVIAIYSLGGNGIHAMRRPRYPYIPPPLNFMPHDTGLPTKRTRIARIGGHWCIGSPMC